MQILIFVNTFLFLPHMCEFWSLIPGIYLRRPPPAAAGWSRPSPTVWCAARAVPTCHICKSALCAGVVPCPCHGVRDNLTRVNGGKYYKLLANKICRYSWNLAFKECHSLSPPTRGIPCFQAIGKTTCLPQTCVRWSCTPSFKTWLS